MTRACPPRQSKAKGDIAIGTAPDTVARLRSFDIALGEVEAALRRLPRVRDAAAAVVPDAGSEERLVAYLVGDAAIDLEELRRRLGTGLPNHMVPSALVTLDALPRDAAGAIDRAALPPPETGETLAPAFEEHGISPIEETILNTFRTLLGRPDLGLDDEFFASGGDSLLATEAALVLEELLGQTAPVAMLGHDGSARALAAALEDAPVDLPAPYVALQEEGRESPLFCVHDLYGRALGHVSLARRLGPHKPAFGLLPGPVREAILKKPDMATLTAAHIATIRRLKPRGPYQVSGYSFGGPFAHEIACALEAEGETVSLVLIDSPIFLRWPRPGFAARWLARSLREARGARATLHAIRASRSIWLRWFVPRLAIGMREIPGFVPRTDHAISRAIMQSRIGWKPRTFGGRALVVRAGLLDPTARFEDEDGMLGWRRTLAGPVTVIEIPGTHNDIMREPLVADIADAVRAEAALLM